MVFGGIISILIAIWVFRTAREAKIGNALFWVAGSFVIYLAATVMMINFNIMIIETFDTDISVEYDTAGGLDARNQSDTAGLQTGPGGTFIGILFELLPFLVPFFIIAVMRQMVMLKQPFALNGLFGGIKEMFISIKNSFKTSETPE